LFVDGGEDGDAVGALLGELVVRGPLEGEVVGCVELGFVDDGLIEVAAGEVVERVGERGHGEVLAVEGDVVWGAGSGSGWRRLRHAGAVAAFLRLGHLGLAGASAERM
jgi:hypothetical protein